MIREPLSAGDEQLMLNALITYGDACARPALTPDCPYYRRDTDGAPYCQEECRGLLLRLGVGSRSVRRVQIGGLVMNGRELPRSAASGLTLFDAQERYLSERLLPPAGQSSSSLLMGLKAGMTQLPMEEGAALKERTKEIWLELGRRDIPVERVIRSGVLPALTVEVVSISLVSAFQEAGLVPLGASDEFYQRLSELSKRTWGAVLDQAVASEGSSEEVFAIALQNARVEFIKQHLVGMSELPLGFGDKAGPREQIENVFRSDVRMAYAMSANFVNRIQDWLNRLLTEDIAALLSWAPPSSALFMALSAMDSRLDDVGLWIWERYTVTSLEDWAESSLVQEWKVHNELVAPPLPPTVWSERKTEEGQVANLALLKSSHKHGKATRRARGLQAEEFVSAAVRHLRVGETQKAADLYSGLEELRPADASVLNNLGFCLVPLSLERALRYLQRASIYPTDEPTTNAANRILVLHLLGRDSEAARLIEIALSYEAEANMAFLWEHTHGGGFRLIEGVNPREYILELREHIRSRTETQE